MIRTFFCTTLMCSHVLLTFLFSSPALADEVYAHDAQFRPRSATLGTWLGMGGEAELYLDMESDTPDTLIDVTGPVFSGVKFVIRKRESGHLNEVEQEYYRVIPGGDNQLTYLGHHVLLTGIEEMPKTDAIVPITLHFERAGPVDIKAKVIHTRAYE